MKLKRFVVILLSLLLAFTTLIGCSKSNDDPNMITIFRWDFVSLDNARRQKTPIYNKVKEVVGADLKAVSASYDQWEGILNNLYNINELPDMFMNCNMDRPINYRKWIKDGAVLPISDYVSETKYPNVYNYLKQYDYLLDRVSYMNGKHYAVYTKAVLEHGFFVRTDWIANLNETEKLTGILTEELGHAPNAQELETYKFKVPETLLDFYRLGRAFVKYDPDGDGKNDTYGYTSSESNMWFNNWIFTAFDSKYDGMISDGNGSLTSSYITEGNADAVAFLNRLYREGIMDPDYIATSGSQKTEAFVTGRVGMMAGNLYYNDVLQKLMASTGKTMEEAKECFAIIAPPAGESGARGMNGNAGFWCGVSLRGNMSAAKREKCLALLDFLLSEEAAHMFTYGIEGVNYEVVDGEKVSLMGKDSAGYAYTVESKDPGFVISTLVDWTYTYYSPYQTNSEEIISSISMMQNYKAVDPVVYVQTPLYMENYQMISGNAQTQFVSMISSNHNSSYDTQGIPTWDNLVVRSNDFNETWSGFVSTFNSDWGGAEMIEEYAEEAVKYLD